MTRKFITCDGDVLEEAPWAVKPTDSCFYCDLPLILSNQISYCPDSQNGTHDWVTITHPSNRR